MFTLSWVKKKLKVNFYLYKLTEMLVRKSF